MKCRKRTRIKVQILFGREIVKCNAINLSIKLDRAATWIQVGGLNKLSNSLDRPRSAFWSFLHYYQGMHMGQPIFMTENRKAAKRLQNKSSSSTWNFKSWLWGCGGLCKSRVGLLSEMKGKASWNHWKNEFQRSPNLEQAWRRVQTYLNKNRRSWLTRGRYVKLIYLSSFSGHERHVHVKRNIP